MDSVHEVFFYALDYAIDAREKNLDKQILQPKEKFGGPLINEGYRHCTHLDLIGRPIPLAVGGIYP